MLTMKIQAQIYFGCYFRGGGLYYLRYCIRYSRDHPRVIIKNIGSRVVIYLFQFSAQDILLLLVSSPYTLNTACNKTTIVI
jgi:hypothetical protein